MKTILEYIINNHITADNSKSYVDLGLPSKTLWATMNLGATPGNTVADWCGGYFMWGDLKKYKKQALVEDWGHYKFGNKYNQTKYNEEDNKKELDLSDDVAYKLTNGKFRIPTKEQFEELLKYTDHEWVTSYKNIPKLNGLLFKSQQDEKITLFIPATIIEDMCDVRVWSTNLAEDVTNAYLLIAYGSVCHISTNERCWKNNIRPVVA